LTVELRRIIAMADKSDWEVIKKLKDPSGKTNASYHLRQAIRLYLQVLRAENKELFEKSKSEARKESTCI